jgi:predicted MPP superfamily phosphohydrolase
MEPDLVLNTGDNLSDDRAVPSVVQALGPLLGLPGAFVFGSNDYYAPMPKNPLSYLGIGRKKHSAVPLPWRDLKAAFSERGWVDATHRRAEIVVGEHRVLVAGVDDPHIGRDRYSEIAGPAGPAFDLRIGLVHSPEPRVLDRFDADGYDLAVAGHTHGGQLCLPTGAIVTNCGIDRSRAQGLSAWGRNLVLHVSAGLGTSPYVPVRTFCRPEATLLELVAGPGGGGDDTPAPVTPSRERVPQPA